MSVPSNMQYAFLEFVFGILIVIAPNYIAIPVVVVPILYVVAAFLVFDGSGALKHEYDKK